MPLVFRLCLCRVACLLIYRSELLGVAHSIEVIKVHSNIVDLLYLVHCAVTRKLVGEYM